MRRDNAPIGYTCSIIDSVIDKMEMAKNEAEYILKYPEDDSSDSANEIVEQLIDAIKEIEDVRSANTELRDWGNEEYNRAEQAEEERYELIAEVERLQDELNTKE